MSTESKQVAVSATYEQMERMAQSLVKSRLFGLETTDQALALMAIAQAEGKHPAIIARDFHIIQGRPAKKSESMLRDFVAAGGSVQWHRLDDAMADATFSHPQGGTVRISWDMDRAKQAGLANKDMYKKFPRQMLRSRTVSEGVRTVAPLCTSGVYTPEEVRDMAVQPVTVGLEPELVDVTPAKASLSDSDYAAHADAMSGCLDLDSLKRAYSTAYSLAKQAGDASAMADFERVKNACKDRLTATEVTE